MFGTMEGLSAELEGGLAAVDTAIDTVEAVMGPLLANPLSQTRADVSPTPNHLSFPWSLRPSPHYYTHTFPVSLGRIAAQSLLSLGYWQLRGPHQTDTPSVRR